MRKFLFPLLCISALICLPLSGCVPAPTEPPPPADTPQPAEAPEPTDTPMPAEAPEEGPPDLTGETIVFYGMGDMSGPYASILASLLVGAQDMVAHINETGGIYGATIELKLEDTGGNVDEAVAIYDRYTGQDDNILMMLLYSSLDEQALRDRIKADQVPTIGSAPDAEALYGAEDGWLFAVMALYPDQLAHFLDYVVANWDQIKPEGAGDEIKLAYVSWPTAYGQAALTDETRAYMEQLGVELVASETYDVSPQADTTTAILNAQAAGANVIWDNTLGFGIANLLNDLTELGVRDQFVVGTNMLGMDIATYAFLADPANAYGLYAAFPFGWYSDTDNPGAQTAVEILNKYERDERQRAIGRLIAQSSIDVAQHAIEQAILEVGYENLTGQAVYDALTQIEDYQVMDGLTAVDYTDGLRAGRQLQIRQVQGGPDKFVILSDFDEAPDMRPAP